MAPLARHNCNCARRKRSDISLLLRPTRKAHHGSQSSLCHEEGTSSVDIVVVVVSCVVAPSDGDGCRPCAPWAAGRCDIDDVVLVVRGR